MGANSLAENTPNTPKFIQPICPIALTQKFGILLKKALSGVRSPCLKTSTVSAIPVAFVKSGMYVCLF